MAWKVIGYVGDTTEEVTTANPIAEVRRFLFKNVDAQIEVLYNGIVRREYKGNTVVEDNINYPGTLKSINDYADALTFVAFVGERVDFLPEVRSTTKKQRSRLLSRRVAQAMAKSEATMEKVA